ncbi:hypothetical protein [Nocardiopsis alba]|uniref:hypothetical protein n=1 Tax=Nocardiopsis alba TaxID=53437 RepID=UPI00340F2CA9
MSNTNDENPKSLWGRLKRRWKALPWYLRLGVQWIGGWVARKGLDQVWEEIKEAVKDFPNNGGPGLF